MNNHKEALEFARSISDIPQMIMMYTYKENEVIKFDSVWIDNHKSEEEILKRLEDKSQVPGFMFYIHSEEGRAWVNKNSKELAQVWMGQVMGLQWS